MSCLFHPEARRLSSSKTARPLDRRKVVSPMLGWAFMFFLLAIVAGVFGFMGIASAMAGIAKVLFVIFIILFLASLILGRKKV